MTEPTRRSHVTTAVLAAMVAATGLNVWNELRGSTPTIATELPIGRRLTVEITRAAETTTLAEVAEGQCTLVVYASESCSAAKATAQKWAMAANSATSTTLVPRSWRVIWIMAEPSANLPDYFGEDFPWPVFRSVRPSPLEAEGWLTAYPATLILDRYGQLVDAWAGGSIPRKETLRDDCTIARDPG